MNSKLKTIFTRLVSRGTPAAGICIAVCLTLAFFLDFDTKIGYFASASPFPWIATGIAVLFLIAVAVDAICFLRQKDLADSFAIRPALRVAAAIAAVAFLFWGFTAAGTASAADEGIRRILLYLAAIASLPAAGYYLTVTRGKTGSAGNALSLFLPVAGALLLGVTYFDYFTPINGAVKIPLQLGIVAVLIADLQELRLRIGGTYARPRVAFAVLTSSGMLCIGVSLPVLVATAAGILKFSEYTACAALLLSAGIYQFALGHSLLSSDGSKTISSGEPDGNEGASADEESVDTAQTSDDNSNNE